ncbi:ORF6N domain-containing protein [Pseudomonas huanghezhanensis]|uniref:ORF6N domain-containing protein n=1 Tax=Pseudomonas huanghezhanensis TaxID=3002903 RepID=UPI00228600BD|nr:ORF6N domain-containing protein [Pseudomonas sp. BSw22131]
MNLITIENTELAVLEYQGRRIVTMSMVDQVHQRPDGTARRTFNEHRDKFREGEDFIELDQPDAIRTLGLIRPQGGTPGKVLIFTEVGYLMLVKPFTDPLAWEVQRQLVNNYFRVAPSATLGSLPANYVEALEAHLAVVKENERLRLASCQVTPQVPLLPDRSASSFQGGLTPTQFARTLNGVNSQKINWHLSRKRWIYDAEKDQRRSHVWRVYSDARDKLLSEDATSIPRPGKSPLVRYKLVLLPKGEKRLWEMYVANELPMKDSWDGEFRYTQHVAEEEV